MMKIMKLFHTTVYIKEKKVAQKVILGCSIIVFICSAFPMFAKSADTTTLCTSEEEVIFSCCIGKKTLSVCASSNLSSNSGYLQYRFGSSLDKLELVFPQTKDHPRSHFRLATDNGARWSSEQISFSVGQTEYIVFSESASFEGSNSGVVVIESGKISTCLECKGCKPRKQAKKVAGTDVSITTIGIPIIKWRNIYSKCRN
jgi:hypothetical protein